MSETKQQSGGFEASHQTCPVCGGTIYPDLHGSVGTNDLHWEKGETWQGKTCSQECGRLFYARETAELEFNTKFP